MKNLTWQNPEQLFVAQELINKVKSKCCGIKVNYKCLCTENIQDVLLGAFDKKRGEFFNIFNKNGEPKITNDMGGPDFIPLSCVYPNLLIGNAEANMCSEEFVQKYQMRGDDNQVLVMMECRQR